MLRVTDANFDPADEIAQFSQRADGAGAITTFLGKVRTHHNGEAVTGLTLQHYPGMTEREIEAILTQAARRWTLEATLVIHRTGFVEPGAPIVLVCTASAHRRAAYEANDFLMDYLKSDALFWKKEHRITGDVWIEPRAEDYSDKKRWERRS